MILPPFVSTWLSFCRCVGDAEKKRFVRLTPGRRDRRRPPRRCSMLSRIWGSVPAPALLRAQLKDKRQINDDFVTKTKTNPKTVSRAEHSNLFGPLVSYKEKKFCE